jgi:hypothetical protein
MHCKCALGLSMLYALWVSALELADLSQNAAKICENAEKI